MAEHQLNLTRSTIGEDLFCLLAGSILTTYKLLSQISKKGKDLLRQITIISKPLKISIPWTINLLESQGI